MDATDVWAKSAARPGQPGESLPEHTSRALASLRQWADRCPDLPGRLGAPALWHRAFWAVCLHDAGKSAHAFQRYLRAEAGPWAHRHEVASLAFVPWVATPESDDFPWICGTIASHHKESRDLSRLYPLGAGDGLAALGGLAEAFDPAAVAAVRRWIGTFDAAWLETRGWTALGVSPPAGLESDSGPRAFVSRMAERIVRALNAYARLRSTIRTGDRAAGAQAFALRGLMMLTDHGASAHQGAPVSLGPEGLARVARGFPELRAHQAAAAATLGDAILVAPTGSGKTEAALLWARAQLAADARAGRAGRRLLYLLPYQASLNAMRVRLRRDLGLRVGLRHGRALLSLYGEALDWDEAPSVEAVRSAERRARRERQLTGVHQDAAVVATPYQLLPMAYRTRGYEAEWTAWRGSLIVMDEVHAYEPERLGRMLAVLDHLRAATGSRMMTLSATLPTWLGPFLSGSKITATAAEYARSTRHRVRMREGGLPDHLAEVARRALGGERILVSVNTVRAALQVARDLADRGVAVRVLHSRLTAEDRARREREIRAWLAAGTRTGVVVATQVIEVSLDLDFDGLYTEPAPLEALVQRFGRLNRQGRLGIADGHILTQPMYGGVYDAELIADSAVAAAQLDGEVVDEAQWQERIDAVYALRGRADAFALSLEESRLEFTRDVLGGLDPYRAIPGWPDEMASAFDAVDVIPEGLAEEYVRRYADSPVHASALHVTVRAYQLRGRGLRRLDELGPYAHRVPWVLDVPYDPALGLLLSQASDDPHEGR